MDWLLPEVDQLIASGGPTIDASAVPIAIRLLMDRVSSGGLKRFARTLARSPGATRAWVHGQATPELGAWAQMAAAAGVRLSPLLMSGSLVSSPDHASPIVQQQPHARHDWVAVRTVLRQAATGSQYIPLRARLTPMGVAPHYARVKEPVLWAAAKQRTEVLRHLASQDRLRAIEEDVDRVVSELAAQHVQPTRRKVEPRLRRGTLRESAVALRWRAARARFPLSPTGKASDQPEPSQP
jgi:hypothetical protein